MFLKVKLKKSTLNLGNCSKLATRYYSPFEILEKIGPVACERALPPSIKVHNVFHVSLLKKYVYDHRDIIDWNMIPVNCRVDFFVLH